MLFKRFKVFEFFCHFYFGIIYLYISRAFVLVTKDDADIMVDEPLKVEAVDDADEDSLPSNASINRCRKRYFSSGRWSFVCVCDANSCDVPEPLGEHSDDEFLVYRSTPEAWRLRREKKHFWKWKSVEETV